MKAFPVNVDSLLNAFHNAENPIKKADILNELADLFTYRNLDSALYFVQEAIIHSRNEGYKKGEIIALGLQAEIFRELGKFKKAIKCTDRLNVFAEDLTDKELLARYYLLSGQNYMFQHSYNQALELFEKSFSLFRDCNDDIGMGDIQRKIGQLFAYRFEDDLMYEYCLGALKCYEKANFQRGIAASMNNIGMYFLWSDEIEKARDLFYKAVDINNREGNLYWLSKNYFNLSTIYQEKGQLDSAFYFSHAASGLAGKVGNPYVEALCLKQEGSIQMMRGNDRIAIKLYRKTLALSRQINSFDNLSMITNMISSFYSKKGYFDSAFFYLTEHNKYKDSLNLRNDNAKYTELKYQMETELNKEKILTRYQRQLFFLMLGFVFLIMMIIILSMHSAKQKIKIRNTMLEKENLENKMELKNKELAGNILATQKKNEMLGSVIKNIEDKMDLLPGKSKEVLGQFVKNLKNVEEDKGWKDFELVFSQIHESFFTSLDWFCPALSLKERRLCALLRLNMSSKQIAEVTQMTPQSVDTARYRLRKKLGIENPAIDLVNFLKNL